MKNNTQVNDIQMRPPTTKEKDHIEKALIRAEIETKKVFEKVPDISEIRDRILNIKIK